MNPLLFNRARVLFFNLWQASRAQGDPEVLFAKLAKAYAAPGRHYHTMNHVVQVLLALNMVRSHINLAQEWAVWFHDIDHSLFDRRCVARSAEVGFNEVRRFNGCVDPYAVRAFIAATDPSTEHLPDPLLWELIDADWSIVGASSAVYAVYADAISDEARPVLYGSDYWKGRVNFLTKALNRGAFRTTKARELWAANSVRNMTAERDRLLQKIASETI